MPLVLSLLKGERYVAGDTVPVTWSGVTDTTRTVRIDLVAENMGQGGSGRTTLVQTGAAAGAAQARLPLTVKASGAYAIEACELDTSGRSLGCTRQPIAIGPLTAAVFFPLESNLAWTYGLGSGNVSTRIVVVHDDGSDTYTLRRDSGYEERFRLTETGLHLDSIVDPTAPFELRFDPPLHLCADEIRIGDSVRSSGTRFDNNAEADHLERPYQADVTVAGTQQISTPAGTFATFKLQGVIITPEAPNILFTLWMAPHIGRVQSVAFGTAPLTLLAFDTESAPVAASETP